MKSVKILWMQLTNFRGQRDRWIEFSGNTNIFGANETGKSTTFDAFTWLLWGKDQFDRKDYQIKTLDGKNEPIHKLDYEVEAEFLVDGESVKLKRTYNELWPKKRGSTKEELTGHETIFHWNGVPLKAVDYAVKVSGMIEEKTFKLITNPTYFNSLDWKERRSVLLSIAGEITSDFIIDKIANAKDDFGFLIGELNKKKSPDEIKKELAAQRKKISDEKDAIPGLIKENQRQIPEVLPDFTGLKTRLAQTDNEIASIDRQLSSVAEASKATSDLQLSKQRDINAKKSAQQTIYFKVKSELLATQNESANLINAAQRKVSNLISEVTSLKTSISSKQSQVTFYQGEIAQKTSRKAVLLEEWKSINKKTFSPLPFVEDESICNCPACGQELPSEKIAESRDLLKKKFDESEALRLERFNSALKSEKDTNMRQGLQLKKEIEEAEEQISILDSQIGSFKDNLLAHENAMITAQNELGELKEVESKKASFDLVAATDAKVRLNGDYMNLGDEIAALEIELAALASGPAAGNSDALKSQKAALNQDRDRINLELGKQSQIEKTEARIKDLSQQEKTLAQAIADIQQHEDEVQAFIKAKMDILEERINSRFKLVQFKMFETQLNEGTKEVCECLVNGVPYPAANTASRINAGLDIINVLCDFYQVTAPVFIDNRESTTNIIHTQSQVISLIVSPQHKVLTVEAA